MSLRLSRASNRIRIAKQKIINYLCEGNRAINDVDRIEHYYNPQSAIICAIALFFGYSPVLVNAPAESLRIVICCPRLRNNLAPDNVG